MQWMIVRWCLLLLGIGALNAQQPSPADKAFGDYLFERGEYYRAITEYQRLMYVRRESGAAKSLLRKIVLCYHRGQDYERCISFINEHRAVFRSSAKMNAEINIYLGKSHYFLRQYPRAITVLEWSGGSAENPWYSETQFILGLAYARVFDWKAAAKRMALVAAGSQRSKIAGQFVDAMGTAAHLPERSALVAGALSTIIPGSGYLYAGRQKTAWAAFLMNGLLIWTVRDALVKEQYGLALTASFLGLGWYGGNIKGSMDAARKYNVHVRNEWIDRLLGGEALDSIPDLRDKYPRGASGADTP